MFSFAAFGSFVCYDKLFSVAGTLFVSSTVHLCCIYSGQVVTEVLTSRKFKLKIKKSEMKLGLWNEKKQLIFVNRCSSSSNSSLVSSGSLSPLAKENILFVKLKVNLKGAIAAKVNWDYYAYAMLLKLVADPWRVKMFLKKLPVKRVPVRILHFLLLNLVAQLMA